ncbi:hypothetical protein EfmJHP80_18690 [Enterococcus faecium]|nr:hypothetical protein EfmJHP80_18690 [Enterococcus faecium]
MSNLENKEEKVVNKIVYIYVFLISPKLSLVFLFLLLFFSPNTKNSCVIIAAIMIPIIDIEFEVETSIIFKE